MAEWASEVPGHVLRALRSRKAAVWLITAIAAYLVVVTAWPHGAAGAVSQWSRAHPALWQLIEASGLDRPYVHPLFLAAIAWLMLATAACAWERSRQAALPLARPEAWRASLGRHAAETPDFVVADSDQRELEAGLVALGLNVQVAGGRVTAVSRRWALLASPVFHWTLVALLALAAVGQLTRAEGVLDIASGAAATDRRGAYARDLTAGPLFGERFSGDTIGVEAIAVQHVVDGVDRGASPLVVLRRDGRTVARAYVYPNAPLRADGLLVHRGAVGPAIRMRFDFPDSTSRTLSVPFEAETGSSRPLPARLDLRIGGADSAVELVPASSGRIAIRTSAGDSGPLSPGGTARLPGGVVATFLARTSYARLIVVHDWTVWWLYAAFIVALLSSCAALFWPTRVVAFARTDGGRWGCTVSASVLDSAFRARVRSAFAPRGASEEGR